MAYEELFIDRIASGEFELTVNGEFIGKAGKNKGHISSSGYYVVSCQADGKNYTCLIHRLVWTWNNGAIPDGYVVHHLDGDRTNNRIENLELLHGNRHAQIKNGREKGFIMFCRNIDRRAEEQFNREFGDNRGACAPSGAS